MKQFLRLRRFVPLLAVVAALPMFAAPRVERLKSAAPVTVAHADGFFVLDNGIVTARINDRTGDLQQLIFRGVDLAGHDQGRVGCWEQDPSAAEKTGGLTRSITIDPAANGGARAEISIKGVTGGKAALTPGAPGSFGGTSNCDLEIRYAMERGQSGVYTYAIFSHPAEYGTLSMPESRFILRLNQSFDWISVDADRNLLACAPLDWGTGVVVHAKEQRIMSQGVYKNSVEHKYSYNAVQYKIPAYGWSSTRNHVGVWFINPTIEYLSGGASKQELVCHFGDNDNPDPIILNYWRGTHYGGGASCIVPQGQAWSKVVGPMLVYVNVLNRFDTASAADLKTLEATAGNPTVPPAWKANATALWQDALTNAQTQKKRWPYDWVNGVDYPHREGRGAVKGRIVLHDPQAASSKLPHLTVGLTHPDPTPEEVAALRAMVVRNFGFRGRPGGAPRPAPVANAETSGDDEATPTPQATPAAQPAPTAQPTPQPEPARARTEGGAGGVAAGERPGEGEGRGGPNGPAGRGGPGGPGGGFFGRRGFQPPPMDWAHDAKYYQFWADGSERGSFRIENVRPGTYTLHAFADGVLGEFARANVKVEAGKTVDLGKLEWQPVRYGKQVWEIGYPTRAGDKFFKGDGANYWLWGWGLRYPLLFPNDVTYTIGKSDYRRDWFFEQVPHGESREWLNPEAKDPANQRFGWVKAESREKYPTTDGFGPWRIYGRGRATTWTIKFRMPTTPKGTAALRVALAGADTYQLTVTVNGKEGGVIHPLSTNALRYNTNKSVWQEQTLKFDAALLKAGDNELQLTVPAGELTSGVVYDYLRLELDERAKFQPPAPAVETNKS